MKLKYKLLLAILAVFIGIGLMAFQSYALWVASFTGGENIVEVGCFSVSYEELSSTISLNNTYPMSDQKGLSGSPYSFKITNTCSNDARYQVTINTLTTNGIPSEKMKYAFYSTDKPSNGKLISTLPLNSDKTNIVLTNLKDSFVLDTGLLSQNESITYQLHLWIDSSAGNEVMNQSFEAGIKVVSDATTIKTVTEYITELATADTTNLAYDGTIDNNLRYIGANPNNYVLFNNELWRIIGVMNNIDDGSGNKASRLKLIRNESIGNYSWDSSDTSINGGYGINEWSQADLNILLNDFYYNAKVNQTCYNFENQGAIACDFSNIGLKEEVSKKLIDSILWNIGSNGFASYTSKNNGLANHFYKYERSQDTGKICSSGSGCNDIVTRTSSWNGKIGLMYPSDYGYATSGGKNASRETCLEKEMFNWHSLEDCYVNNWLYASNKYLWTLTPFSKDDQAYSVFYLNGVGSVDNYISGRARGVRPTLFLKSEVKMFSGDGTESNPYQLSLS